MGGHGDHGHHEVKIPDYRIYKVEDAPLLQKTQRALAAQGLKDPWLRNEVWRYDPKHWGTEKSRFRMLFYRGFGVGLAAAIATVAGTYAYDRMYPSDHHHGHGDHH